MRNFVMIAALAWPAAAMAEPALSQTDLQSLAHLRQNDMLEVKAGNMALKKSAAQDVKTFGKMLVDDHGADARAVLSLVQKNGQALPDVKPVSEADKVDMQLANDAMAKLQGLAGSDFDLEFLRTQVALHDKALAKLDLDIAKIKDNPDLVNMLRGVRPTLVKHADTAKQLLGAKASVVSGQR